VNALYDDSQNISWASSIGLDGFEPWEPEEHEPDDREASTCDYCVTNEPPFTRADPYGGRPACLDCFLQLTGQAPDEVCAGEAELWAREYAERIADG
jgi:hypothetical protein